jgi:hypothetical protein
VTAADPKQAAALGIEPNIGAGHCKMIQISHEVRFIVFSSLKFLFRQLNTYPFICPVGASARDTKWTNNSSQGNT